MIVHVVTFAVNFVFYALTLLDMESLLILELSPFVNIVIFSLFQIYCYYVVVSCYELVGSLLSN